MSKEDLSLFNTTRSLPYLFYKTIALDEYQLENEARLLKLDGKTNDLDYKKRLYPGSDLSHEEMCVKNLQKYLVSERIDK